MAKRDKVGKLLKVKRRYFTKAQKVSILNESNINGVCLSELARKYQVSSVVLYRWRKKMNKEITASFPNYQCVISELEKTKQENEHLKKALGELAVEKQGIFPSLSDKVFTYKILVEEVNNYPPPVLVNLGDGGETQLKQSLGALPQRSRTR